MPARLKMPSGCGNNCNRLWSKCRRRVVSVAAPSRWRDCCVGGVFAGARDDYSGFGGLGADYITEVGQQRRFEPVQGVSLELNTQTRINQRVVSDGVQGFELVSGEVEVQTARLPLAMQAGEGGCVRVRGVSICVTRISKFA